MTPSRSSGDAGWPVGAPDPPAWIIEGLTSRAIWDTFAGGLGRVAEGATVAQDLLGSLCPARVNADHRCDNGFLPMFAAFNDDCASALDSSNDNIDAPIIGVPETPNPEG